MLQTQASIVRQKARIKWPKVVDANTRSFHTSLKVLTYSTRIDNLVNHKGVVLYDEALVRQEVLTFYQCLLRSSSCTLYGNDNVAVKSGKVLNKSQR